MSLHLLLMNSIEENGGVAICKMPIRTETCGNGMKCHYETNLADIAAMLNKTPLVEEKAFPLPKAWFCSEFCMFGVFAQMNQKAEALDVHFLRQAAPETTAPKTNRIKPLRFEEGEVEAVVETSNLATICERLESLGFRAYNANVKPIEGEDAFRLFVCYQELEGALIPNESTKVNLLMDCHMDGTIILRDYCVTMDEQESFESMLRMDQ